ncbi:OmpA/MotB family protein [Fulvivirga lutea]|uniref:OmpA family protein n=1 Tax=Fulvivirga lutea TaxID=2810512 RepID=A0A975A0J5_9BACT|nr:OmpA family protein [Fulvivirga lutea]QSE97270.1 OmpA family protein [Fulvivirga lutea]
MRKVIVFIGLFALVGSCVTQKKYDELLASKINLESDLANCRDSLATALATIDRLNNEIATLKKDTSQLKNKIKNLTGDLSSLSKDHAQLQKLYDNLLGNSGKMTRDLAEQEERLLATKEELERARQQNEQLSADLAVREQKVKELEQILENKDKAVQALKKRINEALLNFKESDLTVSVKNGKVYVSLAEQLLFKSGSTSVDPKGVSALQQLAKAIKDQEDLNIMVEGHTDDVPISRTSQYMNDNWDLSVLRATSIIRILTKAGVSSDQVMAAGRGEFMPVDSNDTKEGRQKNRRTEIIITPNLDELFQILETN